MALVLVIAVLWVNPRGKAPQPAQPGNSDLMALAAVPPPTTVVVVKTNLLVYTNSPAFTWTALESEDYRAYIQRLRAIGCPEQTIRDIIISDLDKLLAPQLHAILGLTNRLGYWQSENKEFESAKDRRERQRLLREVDLQKRAVVQQLLGVDLVSERERVRGEADAYGRRLEFLPETKRDQVRTLIERAAAEEATLRQKVWQDGEPLTAEEQARLRQLQAERETSIAALLSPDEQRQYELTLSPTAGKVRDSLFGMNASEQEYLSLFQVQKTFDEKWPQGLPENASLEDQARYAQDQQTMLARVKEQLGDDRFHEFQRAQDPDYRQLRIAAAQNNLPLEAANEVYEMRRELAQQQALVMTSQSLKLDRKREILNAMGDEAARSVRGVIGDPAFRAYMRSGAGAWMRGGVAP